MSIKRLGETRAFFWFFADYRVPGARLSGWGFFSTSHLAPRARLAFGFAGSASPSLSTLGRLAGETLVPTLAAQTVLRVRKGKAANAAHVSIWPTAAPLVRNSPRGWAPRSLTTIRLSEGEPLRDAVVGPGRSRNTRAMRKRFLEPSCRSPSSRPCRRTCRRCCRALARPTRASGSGRVFGAHPRGEFRTSERPQAT
jgi:hypothetical protein